MQLGDVTLDYNMDSNGEEFVVSVTVPQLSFDIVMDYEWTVGFLRGSGEIVVQADDRALWSRRGNSSSNI